MLKTATEFLSSTFLFVCLKERKTERKEDRKKMKRLRVEIKEGGENLRVKLDCREDATNKKNNHTKYTRGLICSGRSVEPSDWPPSYKVLWHHQWWRARQTPASRERIQNIFLGLRRPSKPNVDMVIYFLLYAAGLIVSIHLFAKTRLLFPFLHFTVKLNALFFPPKLLLSLRASFIVKPFSYKPLASMPLMQINGTNINLVALLIL